MALIASVSDEYDSADGLRTMPRAGGVEEVSVCCESARGVYVTRASLQARVRARSRRARVLCARVRRRARERARPAPQAPRTLVGLAVHRGQVLAAALQRRLVAGRLPWHPLLDLGLRRRRRGSGGDRGGERGGGRPRARFVSLLQLCSNRGGSSRECMRGVRQR